MLGAAAIAMPLLAALAVELLLGWLLVIGGIAQAFHAFGQKQWGGFLWQLLMGVLYLVVGGMLLIEPLRGVLTLTFLLAVFFVVEGILRIILSLRLRPVQNWGWMLVSGLVTLVLGALIWANWPSAAVWAIGMLVGIDMIFGGWSLIMLASAARKDNI